MQADLLLPREEAVIRGAFRDTLAGVAPSLAEDGDRMLDRLTPHRWLLEWGLPLWLGESYGLADEVSLTLALCNLLGLTYVRIQDDLTDGEVVAPHRSASMALATVAFQQAIISYARLFGDDERFWMALEQRLGQWAQSLAARPDLLPGFTAHPQHPALRRLSHAGAPAHIGLAGACLLSQRDDLLPRLSAALDDWLLANVLLDHARDWQADLEAGRYNYFIAHTTAIEQIPSHSQAIRRHLLELTYLGDGGQAYFDFVLALLANAQVTARPAACTRLSLYLEWFAGQVKADLGDDRQHALDQLRSAKQILFGKS